MTEVSIETDEKAHAEIEALAADRGVTVSDFIAEMVADGLAMHQGVAMLNERAARGDREAALAVLRKVPHDDPLGYDTSDEEAAIRQMCDNALSGRNKDAVRAEVDAAQRRFGPFR